MGKTAWPTAEEVADVLPSDVASTVAADYIASAVADVEDRTGYRPFLVASDSQPTTRTFFPPDARTGRVELKLNAGVVGITSVKVDVYEDGSGTELLLGTEWNPLPLEAPDTGRPYTKILFGKGGADFSSLASAGYQVDFRVSTASPKVSVTGLWGFGTEIPADLWDAVRDYAAARCVKQAQLKGPVKMRKQGDRQVQYQDATGWTSLTEAQSQLAEKISKYARIA